MNFHGVKLKENGISFGMIVVHESVLLDDQETAQMQGYGKKVFGPISIILMAYDHNGSPIYRGRRDIIKLLPNLNLKSVALTEYTV